MNSGEKKLASLILLFASCDSQHCTRDFFTMMKESHEISSSNSKWLSWQIGGFGLSTGAKVMDGKCYYKLSCDDGTSWPLKGFIRHSNDSVFFRINKNTNDQLLFSFGEQTSSLHLVKNLKGDVLSIERMRAQYDSVSKERNYPFRIGFKKEEPPTLPPDVARLSVISVNRKTGISGLTYCGSDGCTFIRLYPKLEIIH